MSVLTYAGITFDGALIQAVQAEVLREGITPDPYKCVEALYRAYAGVADHGLIAQAAQRVWADRHHILAQPGDPR